MYSSGGLGGGPPDFSLLLIVRQIYSSDDVVEGTPNSVRCFGRAVLLEDASILSIQCCKLFVVPLSGRSQAQSMQGFRIKFGSERWPCGGNRENMVALSFLERCL